MNGLLQALNCKSLPQYPRLIVALTVPFVESQLLCNDYFHIREHCPKLFNHRFA